MPNNCTNPLRIAVLASGSGLTLTALLEAIALGELAAQIVGVISNHADSGAMQRAKVAGVSAQHLSAEQHPDFADRDQALVAMLQALQPEIVVTAGYMQRLGPLVMHAFQHRMVNVHPSLLPKFGGAGMYGRHVHAAVLAAGETESGATVHLVEGDYDSGPILAAVGVAVHADDTVASLEARVKLAERALLIEVLQRRARLGNFSPR